MHNYSLIICRSNHTNKIFLIVIVNLMQLQMNLVFHNKILKINKNKNIPDWIY